MERNAISHISLSGDIMNKFRQEYLISYDVAENKRRTKLHKELLSLGLRSVQKSVFWGYLSIAELHAVKRSLKKFLDTQDRGFIVQSHFQGRGKSYFVGHIKEDFEDWKDADVI